MLLTGRVLNSHCIPLWAKGGPHGQDEETDAVREVRQGQEGRRQGQEGRRQGQEDDGEEKGQEVTS